MLLHGVEIEREHIPEYFNDEMMAAIELWHKWKMFGFPFAGGFAEQPAVYVAAIEACEIGYRRIHGKS